MAHSLYPCLWFDGQAQAAAECYCTIFENAAILESNPLAVSFTLNDTRFMALNGGPAFRFNEAVSIVVPCDTQAEIDHYWNRLSEGGEQGQCGWLKDKFGLSWQIVPAILPELMRDPARAGRVTQAFLQMKKFDIEQLLQA